MTSWTSGTCRANGIDIHYLRTGGAKPPVVLLHGLTGNGACWTPLARALERDHDVVMPDARGHGRSSAPPHGYGYDDHARDVIDLIRALDLDAPVVLGHSMGGMTAAVVASRLPSLRGVVLVDPTFLSAERQREVYDSDVVEQHRQLLERDERDVLARLRAKHPHRSPELLEIIAGARTRTQLRAFDVLAPPNPDCRELVRRIDAPILLVISDGGVVSLDTARELEHLHARLTVELIRDAGHGIQYDQPERFATVVASFLHRIVPPSARTAIHAAS